MSPDYHDYVFRNGRLVGDFEGMYRHAAGEPWDQGERLHLWWIRAGFDMLAAHGPFGSALEIGCGLGYVASELRTMSREVDACDVSPTAISRARSLHHGIGFYVDDACAEGFQPRRRYALVVLKDLLWYVLADMEAVRANVGRCVLPDGLLFVSQTFPPLDRPFVGRDTLPCPSAIPTLFPDWQPVASMLVEHPNDGPVFHWLARLR